MYTSRASGFGKGLAEMVGIELGLLMTKLVKFEYYLKECFMNVSFTEKQEEYIVSLIESGDYQDASEVVRDAMRIHQWYRDRLLSELRAEIAKGWDGPASPRTVKDIIKDKLNLQH